jgi:molecular chaperone GrpE
MPNSKKPSEVESEPMTAETEQSEVDRLKRELEREHDMHLRALADFDNYRRRTERDRASTAQRAKRDIVLPLIELLDGFEQALQHADEDPSSVLKGVSAIHRQLVHILEEQGVTPFDSTGEHFDPALHEAVGSSPREEQEPGTITKEVRRGYRSGDELLRPARVLVAQ